MSWSISKCETYEGMPDELSAEDYGKIEAQNKGAQAAAAAAYEAALSVMESLVIGNGVDSYLIEIGGHSNPDHQPVEGYMNDYVYIKVAQI